MTTSCSSSRFLYPPLTYLSPTGRHQELTLQDGDTTEEVLVIECVPYYAS
jgi:hypothetical protein